MNNDIATTGYVTSIKNLNVLGIDWINALHLNDVPNNIICKSVKINQESICKNNNNFLNVKKNFSGLFDRKTGLCNKTTANLVVKPDKQPVFRPPLHVTYAVRHLVDDEVHRLQDEGIISPVNYTYWAVPIVVLTKTDGRIRLCADFSTGLNHAIDLHQYPLSHPNDIFSKISSAKVFSHIDWVMRFFK